MHEPSTRLGTQPGVRSSPPVLRRVPLGREARPLLRSCPKRAAGLHRTVLLLLLLCLSLLSLSLLLLMLLCLPRVLLLLVLLFLLLLLLLLLLGVQEHARLGGLPEVLVRGV